MKFYQRFREPKLFRYAKQLKWDKIILRCQKHPRVAAREAKFQHEYAPNETALHALLHPFFLLSQNVESLPDCETLDCMLETRHMAAAALLEKNQNAALVPCVLGTIPLTLVCMDPFACLKDLDILLESCPKSALVKDLEGRTPLHYACINNRANLAMIQKMLQAAPEAARLEDRLGRMPLHFACMAPPSHSNHGSFTPFAHFFEEKVSAVSGKVPICSEPVLRLLLTANSNATVAVDDDGMTPLHHLMNYIQTVSDNDDMITMDLLELLYVLVQANPKAATFLARGTPMTPRDIIQKLHTSSQDLKQIDALKKILIICQ